MAERLGVLVSGQVLLWTHSRICGVNGALGNGTRLHNGNDIDLVCPPCWPHRPRCCASPQRGTSRGPRARARGNVDRPQAPGRRPPAGGRRVQEGKATSTCRPLGAAEIHCASVSARIAAAISSFDRTDTSVFNRPPSSPMRSWKSASDIIRKKFDRNVREAARGPHREMSTVSCQF